MINIISSDLFRIRKGKAFYGVMIGILVFIVFAAIGLAILRSPSFYESMEANQGVVMMDEDIKESAEMIQSLESSMPKNGSEFMAAMFAEGAEILLLLLLPFVIAVFGGDYSAGTFRNLLSYHSKRGKIYGAKLITSLILTLISLIAFAVISMVTGTITFGFGGLGAGRMLMLVKGILLMLPMLAACVCVGHCIMAFTKRNSYTISIYLVGMLVWSMVLQGVAFLVPSLAWVLNMDLTGTMGRMLSYPQLSSTELLAPLVFSAVLIVGTTLLGGYKYSKTDFDFN